MLLSLGIILDNLIISGLVPKIVKILVIWKYANEIMTKARQV
jgi:hypothetical protein